MSFKKEDKNIFLYVCSHEDCQEKTNRLRDALRDNGCTGHYFPLNFHPTSDDVLSKLDECDCLVFVICEHTMKRHTTLVEKISESDRLHEIVLVKVFSDSCQGISMSKAVYDIVYDTKDFETAITKITGTAKANIKQPGREQTESDAQRQRHASCKQIVVSHEASKTDRFVDAVTTLPEGRESSIMVRESFCCRVECQTSAEELTTNFNRTSDRDQEEIRRAIMCHYIPKFVISNDFRSMAYLLGCHCYKMKNAILSGLSRILLKMDISRQSRDYLLKLEKSVWDVYFSTSNDEYHSAEYAASYLEVVTTLHLRSSSFGHISEDGMKDWEKEVSQLFLVRIKTLNEQVVVTEKRDTMSKQVAECVKFVLHTTFAKYGQLSTFYFGDLENALKHEDNRRKMEKISQKLKYYEYFEIILCLLSGFNRSLDARFLDVLKDVCRNIFFATLAKGYYKVMLQIFCCRLVVTLLNGDIKHHFRSNSSQIRIRKRGKISKSVSSQGEEDDFCHNFASILAESVINDITQLNDTARKHLLEVLFPLVYHRSDSVSAVIRHHIDLFRNKLELHRYPYDHMEYSLQIMNLHTKYQQGRPNESADVEWERFSCKIGDRRGYGFILQPSWKVHSLQTFIQSRNGNKDKHVRNMEVLLRISRKHECISNLLAYSIKSPPFFFIKEDFGTISENFSDYLMKLYEKEFIETTNLDQLLTGLIIGAVSAVDFLHDNGFIHTDITARRFNVTVDGANIKLSDFRHARRITGDHASGDPTVDNLPARWTAPESILSNRFSILSDVHMIGAFMIEVYCKGLWPYTEHYSKPLEEVLELIVFHHVKPIHHPCIPASIYNLCLRCMAFKPQSRISLEKLLAHLNTVVGDDTRTQDHGVLSMFRKDKYPDMDVRQKRMGKPETGIPHLFKAYTNDRDPYGIYYNTKIDKRRPQTELAVTELDITAADKPVTWRSKTGLLSVEERVDKDFCEEIWPDFCNIRIRNIMTSTAQLKHDAGFGDERGILTLVYDCRGTESMSKVAPKLAISHLLQIIYLTARNIDELHRIGIIHRDIRADNVFIQNDPQKHQTLVCVLRLAKMRRLTESESIRAETSRDSWRWDPVESLMHGIYSKKSDSYRLAMFAWEIFCLKEIYKKNSRPNPMRAVPFSCVLTKAEVIDEQLLGYKLPKPSDECPDWLYMLLLRCWRRESVQRPSMEEITTEIYSRVNPKPNSHVSDSHDAHDNGESDDDENNEFVQQSSNWKHDSGVCDVTGEQPTMRIRSTNSLSRENYVFPEHSSSNASLFSNVSSSSRQTNSSYSASNVSDEHNSSNVFLLSNVSSDGGSTGGNSTLKQSAVPSGPKRKSLKGFKKSFSRFVGKFARRSKSKADRCFSNSTYNVSQDEFDGIGGDNLYETISECGYSLTNLNRSDVIFETDRTRNGDDDQTEVKSLDVSFQRPTNDYVNCPLANSSKDEVETDSYEEDCVEASYSNVRPVDYIVALSHQLEKSFTQEYKPRDSHISKDTDDQGVGEDNVITSTRL